MYDPDSLLFFWRPIEQRIRARKRSMAVRNVETALWMSPVETVTQFLALTDADLLGMRLIGPRRLRVARDMQARIRARQAQLLRDW